MCPPETLAGTKGQSSESNLSPWDCLAQAQSPIPSWSRLLSTCHKATTLLCHGIFSVSSFISAV